MMNSLKNENKKQETDNNKQSKTNFVPIWENKMNYNEQKNYIMKAERQRQFYARHMEMYKTSLHASQNLHHKITRENNTISNKRPEKLSKKAIEAKLKNSQRLLEIEEKKDVERIADFERNAHTISELDIKLKLVKSPSEKLLFNVIKLRIKLIQKEKSINSKVQLFLCIKEIFENYNNFLTESDDAKELIKILIDLQLNEIAKYLAKKIPSTKKQETLSKIFNSLNIDTFNKDVYFQLNCVGEYLERSLNSQKDSRVCFKPDKWQQNLLDIVDNSESALICAPTSSGKTFISYYAMEKILRSNINDVVVFISPNKSLANQVAAEIYTRFGHLDNVYAMSMPDYIVNDPFSCQILVTVPSTFESMLSDNSEWVKKIKYIIIDEIQTMNEIELGTSLEKIIHFAECPILALSATIGNLQSFYEWMKAVQYNKGIKVHCIVHTERFCDLKKFLFVPSALKTTNDTNFETLIPLNELYGYSSSHFSSTKSLSDDFHLLPNEIYKLLKTITKFASTHQQQELVKSLLPEQFFECVLLNKSDVKRYEKFLVKNLKSCIQKGIFSQDQTNLIFNELNGECDEAFAKINHVYGQEFCGKEWMIQNISKL